MGKMKGESGGFYQTFDSGDGPVVPSSAKGDFAHQDSGEGLSNYTSNKADDEQGSVPEVPKTKR